MNFPDVLSGSRNRSRWSLLLVLAVLATVLVAGCTSFLPGSKGTPAAGQPGPWTGSWDTDWGTMQIVQNGNLMTGSYVHNGGKLVGTASGNTLTGTWSEASTYTPPDHAGDFEFTLSPDGKSFTGKWRYGSNTGTWDGNWKGEKQ